MKPTMLTLLLLGISLCAEEPKKAEAIPLTAEKLGKLKEIAFQAAREGDTKTVEEYLKLGRPIDERNARGDTLLTVAAYYGQPKVVEVILKQPKVEVDAKNKMGLTALTAAAFRGYPDVGELLVKSGANVNFANDSGQTALMFAAMTNRTKMVEFLLKNKADPDAKDEQGNTARRLAETQGAADVLKLLDAKK